MTEAGSETHRVDERLQQPFKLCFVPCCDACAAEDGTFVGRALEAAEAAITLRVAIWTSEECYTKTSQEIGERLQRGRGGDLMMQRQKIMASNIRYLGGER